MGWLQSLFYGLISGLSEFLPVSAHAHRSILRYLYGGVMTDPVQSLVMNIATLVALITVLKPQLDQIQRIQRTSRRNHSRINKSALQIASDVRVVKNAAIITIPVMLLLRYILHVNIQLPWVCLMLLINGIILFLPERMMHGNKDGNSMTQMDSYLIGIAGAMSVFSGISAIAMILSVAIVRGADHKRAWNWALLLSIFILSVNIFMDLISIFSGTNLPFFSNLFRYLLTGAIVFLAARASISIMKKILLDNRVSVFAYYCWGAALFSFLLYLSVV